VDPEAWHKIMDCFFAILSEGVRRFEGRINKYNGDGIMAFSGAPLAREGHARPCFTAFHLRSEFSCNAGDLRREAARFFRTDERLWG
jgi:class 3 adenylate cyclase